MLAEKEIFLFEENGELSAYKLEFKNLKLHPTLIDTLRGNENDEDLLYNSVILEGDQGTIITALFYFKDKDVFVPNRKGAPQG